MTGNAAWKGELREEPLQPLFILRDVRVDLAISTIEVGVCHEARSAVAWTRDVHYVQFVYFNDAIEMDVDEIQARRRSPVTKQAGLDVLALQRLPEERVIIEVNLTN